MKKIRCTLLALLIGMLCSALAIGDPTITKRLIEKEDIDLTQDDNASAETVSVTTSTGATMTMTRPSGGMFPWDNAYTRTIRPGDIVSRGPQVDVRSFMDGVSGRPKQSTWNAAQTTTDVTAVIQAAIDNVHAAGGGTVFFPKGQYLISATIVCYSNMRFIGGGVDAQEYGVHTISGGATIMWDNTVADDNTAMVSFNDTYYNVWDGISLRGNMYNDTGIYKMDSLLTGFTVNNTAAAGSSHGIVFKNLSVFGLNIGFDFSKDYLDAGNTDGMQIENATIYLCNTGIYGNTSNGQLHIKDTGITAFDYDIYLYSWGMLHLSSVNLGGRAEDPMGGVMIYVRYAHSLYLEHVQTETGATEQDSWWFLESGPSYTLNMTILNSIIGNRTTLGGPSIINSIGNLWAVDVTINSDTNYITSIGDQFVYGTATGAFVDNSAAPFANHITKLKSGVLSFTTGITPSSLWDNTLGVGNMIWGTAYQPSTAAYDNAVVQYVGPDGASVARMKFRSEDNTVVTLYPQANVVAPAPGTATDNAVIGILTILQNNGLMVAP
jgi:hypothetical protein